MIFNNFLQQQTFSVKIFNIISKKVYPLPLLKQSIKNAKLKMLFFETVLKICKIQKLTLILVQKMNLNQLSKISMLINLFEKILITVQKMQRISRKIVATFIQFIQKTFQSMFDLLPEFCESNLDLSNFIIDESTEINLQTDSQIQKTTILRDTNLSICSYIGRRNSNLDKYSYIITQQYQLYGLFDGHGDDNVSTLLSSCLLRKIIQHPQFFYDQKLAIYQAIQSMELQAMRLITSGSTALVVLITNQKILIANIGDTMAIGKTITQQTLRLNHIHNFENPTQMKRVINNGGYVIKRGKQYRLNGQLNLTRSIGDSKHKQHLSFEPQFTQFPKNVFSRLILVTDGLWNLNNSTINHQTTLNIVDDLLAGYWHNFEDNATFMDIRFD